MNSLKQTQKQMLKQTLSLKQIQYLKLLSMNAAELNDYITTLNTENPLVELQYPDEAPKAPEYESIKIANWLTSAPTEDKGSYDNDDEPTGEFTPRGQIQDDRLNLMSHLRSQFDFSLQDFDISLLEILLGSLDKRGYLRIDADTVAKKGYDRELVLEAIGYLQSLDPAGIGAFNLQDCLILQLRRLDEDDEITLSMIKNHMEDLAKGYFQKIAKALDTDIDTIKASYSKIKKLNPMPASGFGSYCETPPIIPDVTVFNTPHGIQVRYNKDYHPHLSVNKSYLDMARQSPETGDYINKKLTQALWVMKAIDSRQSTIEKIVTSIVARQNDFFVSDGPLVPLKLRDIAAEIGVHESTVSRATCDKYLECQRGIFSLKSFFSGDLSQCGDENVKGISSEAVMREISLIIDGENKKKPYSDNDIIKLLQAKSIFIARRTVAKYRDILGIRGSSMRKE
ncbi:MAG: RNA polymerase factor sigma-54 [Oscillospiraceae bacterium]